MEKIYNGENRYMIKWIIFDAMGVVFVEGKASRNARLEAYYSVKALLIHLTKIV